jgi:hypothetical protein
VWYPVVVGVLLGLGGLLSVARSAGSSMLLVIVADDQVMRLDGGRRRRAPMGNGCP